MNVSNPVKPNKDKERSQISSENSLLDDSEEKFLEKKAKNYSRLAWIFSGITILFPVCGLLLVKIFKVDFDKLGPYGDFIAGSTIPFLTFSSFVLLTATLITQQVQLKIQMKELKLTREEYAKTNLELDEQNKTLLLQRFENTFFNILSSHNEIMESIRPKFKEIYEKFKNKAEIERELKFLNDNNSIIFDEHLLKWYTFEPRNFIDILNGERINENASISLDFCRKNKGLIDRFFNNIYKTREFDYTLINQIYKEIYNEYHHLLGHYFRSLHRLVKYVDNSHIINVEEKKFYLGIVRSQISSYEHIMLFYNCLSSYGNNSFLPMVKEYDFLDQMKSELLINTDVVSHMDLFENFDDLDVETIFSLDKSYQLGFHKKWFENINNLKNYKSIFEFRIKEIATNYIQKQLIIPKETIKTINENQIDDKLEIRINVLFSKMDKYEKTKINEVKNKGIGFDYLTNIRNECKLFTDESIEIYYNAQGNMKQINFNPK